MKTHTRSLFLGFVLTSLTLAGAGQASAQNPKLSAQQERIVAEIRKDIASDSTLSNKAKQNLEFQTVGHRIALVGPVTSPKERCRIMVLAQNVAGFENIADRMYRVTAEVTPAPNPKAAPRVQFEPAPMLAATVR